MKSTTCPASLSFTCLLLLLTLLLTLLLLLLLLLHCQVCQQAERGAWPPWLL
jgi:hypothetical protein